MQGVSTLHSCLPFVFNILQPQPTQITTIKAKKIVKSLQIGKKGVTLQSFSRHIENGKVHCIQITAEEPRSGNS